MYEFEKKRAQMIGHSKQLTPYIVYHAILTPIGNNDDFKEAFTAYQYTGPEQPSRKVPASLIKRKMRNQREYNKEFSYSIYYIDPNETEQERIKAAKEHILLQMAAEYKREFHPTSGFPFVEGQDYILDLHREHINLNLGMLVQQ